MGEIIIIAGPPASGKTSLVHSWTQKGYTRLNRDEIGGSLGLNGQVYNTLRQKVAEGVDRFVLDNVYANKASRAVLMTVAKEVGLPVHVVWLDTTPEQAQFFAALREIRKHGRLIGASEYAAINKDDSNTFPPVIQFSYWKNKEDPSIDEGFASITHVKTVIDLGPQYRNRAIILDYDGTLRETKSGKKYPTDPDDVVLLEGRRDLLHAKQKEGYLILGASNQSGVAQKPSSPLYATEEQVKACFERTNELLGIDIDYMYAPEAAGVPQSYRRKPMPGMGVFFIEKYRLDPKQCIYVGDRPEDKGFASRCGFQFAWAEDFFR